MADLSRPDLCIVGAGALGIALARHAKRLGADVVLVDRGMPEAGDAWQHAIALAGLRHSASAAQLLRTGEALGFGNDAPKVKFKALQGRLESLQADWAAENSPERLTALGIRVLAGPTRFVGGALLEVGETRLRPRNIVLAMGSVSNRLDIPGLDQIDFFTPDSLLGNARKLTHLLVIGGDPAGLALGQAYQRLGCAVTIVPHGADLAGYDAEALAILKTVLEREGVRILDGAKVVAIQPRSQGIGATVEGQDGATDQLDVSHILVSAGRSPDVDGLALDVGRVRKDAGSRKLETGPAGRTGNRLVRVTGAAAGIESWMHALAHGRVVVESVAQGGRGRLLAAQPRLIQTEPALAQIGRMPAPDEKLRGDHRLVRASFAENAEALARNQSDGMVKVLTTAKGQILGASAVGAGAVEVVSVLAMALEQGVTLDRLANMSLPDPGLLGVVVTLGENFAASRPVSAWTTRLQALRRYLPF